jgi:hypothetical protein
MVGRGRPRDEAADRRALSAAWELLHAGGYAAHPEIGELVRAQYAERHALARARLERAVAREGLRADLDQAC